MAEIPITVVRFDDAQARDLLETFVFGGMFGGARAPRGIEPDFVTQFVQERLTAESGPIAYSQVGELMRFYERTDLVSQMRLGLSEDVSDEKSFRRAAHAAQAIADLGTLQDVRQASDYFDATLANRPQRSPDFRLLLQTRVALAPTGSLGALNRRLAAEVERLEKKQNESEDDMMTYDDLAAIQRNDLPKAKVVIAGKSRLLSQSTAERCPELVQIYLGRSPLSDAQMETWSGRLLRLEARRDDERADEVRQSLSQALDALDPDKLPGPQFALAVRRAAQAILYLRGQLSDQQQELYQSAEDGAMNFLWDDI